MGSRRPPHQPGAAAPPPLDFRSVLGRPPLGGLQAAFADCYRTTILADETDPNKLHDLKADLDGYHVYAAARISTSLLICT